MEKPLNRILINLSILVVLGGFVIAMCGISLYWMGFHNIDLSYNVMRISYFENLNYEKFYDTTLGGYDVSYDEGYRMGSLMQIEGILLIIAGLIIAVYELDSLSFVLMGVLRS